MPKWTPQVRFLEPYYYAFAVHTNGKVELEGSYFKLIDAIYNAKDLSNMLTLYHRYAGQYKGDAKLIGRKISQSKVDKIIIKYRKAIKKLFESTNNIALDGKFTQRITHE